MSEYCLILNNDNIEEMMLNFLEILEYDDIIVFEYKKNEEKKYDIAKKILENKNFNEILINTSKNGKIKTKYIKKSEF